MKVQPLDIPAQLPIAIQHPVEVGAPPAGCANQDWYHQMHRVQHDPLLGYRMAVNSRSAKAVSMKANPVFQFMGRKRIKGKRC